MEKVWFCKIGVASDSEVPDGGDGPMRDAVEAAYKDLLGFKPDFIFSGWGGKLTEGERAADEDRLPDPVKVAAGALAGLTAEQRQLLDDALRVGTQTEERGLLREALDVADELAGYLA